MGHGDGVSAGCEISESESAAAARECGTIAGSEFNPGARQLRRHGRGGQGSNHYPFNRPSRGIWAGSRLGLQSSEPQGQPKNREHAQ